MPPKPKDYLGIAADLVGDIASPIIGNRLAQSSWNKQADYNSPANQMKRYQAAGLNPNLIYGTGTAASSGNMSSPAQTEAPQLHAQDSLLKYQNLQNLRQQEVNLKTMEAFIQANTQNKNADTGLKTNYLPSLYETQMANNTAMTNLNFSKMRAQEIQNRIMQNLEQNTYATSWARLNNLYKQTEYLVSKNNLTTKQLENLDQILTNLKLDASLKNEVLQWKQWQNTAIYRYGTLGSTVGRAIGSFIP